MQIRLKQGKIAVRFGKKRGEGKPMGEEELRDIMQTIYDRGREDATPITAPETLILDGIALATNALERSLKETKGVGEKLRISIMSKYTMHTDVDFTRKKKAMREKKDV